MLLIIILIIAAIVTSIHFLFANLRPYRLGTLALMLWGAFVVLLFDHILTNLDVESGVLNSMIAGLAEENLVVGVMAAIPIIMVWITAMVITNRFNNTT